MLVYLTIFALELVTIPIYLYRKSVYLIINIIPLWVVMAYRSFNVGIDTPTYQALFYQHGMFGVDSSFINWLFPYHSRFENGFLLLNHLVYTISPNFQLMLIATSTIMLACLLFLIIQLKINYVIGIFIYETISFMPSYMNLMRQGLAVSFCMIAFVYAVRSRPIKFFLFTYLAATMHVTAWLFLPVYFLKKVKLNKQGIIGISVIAIVFLASFEFIYSKLASISDEAQSFSESIANNNGNGLMNIAISAIIILLLLNISRKLTISNQIISYSQTMLLLTLVVYVLTIKFSQISRLAMYFMIGVFPILSVGI